MEFKEIQDTWSQFDKKMNENLKFNKTLLQKMNLDGARKSLSTPKNYELGSIIVNFLLLIFTFSITIKFISDMKFFIPGTISCIIIIVLIILNFQKMKLMYNLEFQKSSIDSLPKQIATLQTKIIKCKQIEFTMFPIFAIVFPPVFTIAVKGYDFYQHPYRFGLGLMLSVSIGYLVGFWIYKHLYEKKLIDARILLDEINKLEE